MRPSDEYSLNMPPGMTPGEQTAYLMGIRFALGCAFASFDRLKVPTGNFDREWLAFMTEMALRQLDAVAGEAVELYEAFRSMRVWCQPRNVARMD